MASKPRTKASRCTVCRHKERHLIEKMRVVGVSLDVLAAKFGLGRDAVHRHMRSHVTDDVKNAYLVDAPLEEMAARVAEENISLLGYLGIIRSTLMQGMLMAASANDRHGTANLGGRALDCLERIGKLTGQISTITSTTTNTMYIDSPDFLAVELMLSERLAPFPDARRAVLAGLGALSGRHKPMAATEPLTLLAGPSDD